MPGLKTFQLNTKLQLQVYNIKLYMHPKYLNENKSRIQKPAEQQ